MFIGFLSRNTGQSIIEQKQGVILDDIETTNGATSLSGWKKLKLEFLHSLRTIQSVE